MRMRKAISKSIITIGFVLAVWFIWAFEDGGWTFSDAFLGEIISLLVGSFGVVWYDGLKDREDKRKW